MRILVCYSDKPRGVAAIELAQDHAAKWQAEIDVVWAVSREKALAQKGIQEFEEELEGHVTQLFESSGIAYKVHLLIHTTSAGDQIVDFAKQIKSDMIVLGLRKRSLVGKVIFGSNSQNIIMNAPCPVLTTRRK